MIKATFTLLLCSIALCRARTVDKLDILEGAGAFSGPTFHNDFTKATEPIFSATRWQHIFADQEKKTGAHKYKQIGLAEAPYSYFKGAYEDVTRSQGGQASKNMTYLEFHKYDTEDAGQSGSGSSKAKKRKITYNDGIVYMFDTYGKMLEARYQQKLKQLKDYNAQKKKEDQLLSADNIEKPSRAYTQPKHIKFKVSTVTLSDDGKEPGKECCDVRLTTVDFKQKDGDDEPRMTPHKEKDVVFFRLG